VTEGLCHIRRVRFHWEASLSRIALDDAQVLHRLQERRKLSLRLIIAVLIPVVAVVQSSWPSDGTANGTIEAIGLTLIVLCVLGRVWCALYIGGRKSTELVDLGPYSVSRNPLYLFSCLGAIGVGFCTGSSALGAFFLVAATTVMIPVVRVEEMVMTRTFGTSFEDYRARVPRFWPRLSLWRDAELLSLAPRHLYRVFGDSLFFASAIPVVDAIAWLQTHGVLPVLLRLP
jgi:protein-S-isoprenylcysteine O-methyltransferase Ste14